jgi:hypothetical protein
MVNYARIKAMEIFSLIYQSKKDQKKKNPKIYSIARFTRKFFVYNQAKSKTYEIILVFTLSSDR